MEAWAYEDVLAFTQSWGVVYFLLMFAAAFTYALWPSNKEAFQEAARMPLNDDGDI